jgi:hypothetical protein
MFFASLTALFVAAADAALMRGGSALYFGPPISDLGEQFFLWRTFLCRWFQRGVFPFWDMHAFGGYPVVEMQQVALFHPVSLLSTLLFDPALGLKVWMAGVFTVGAVATYVALRRALACRAPTAFFVTVAFFWGGALATRVEAGHFTVVAASAMWIPALACVWVASLAVGRGGLQAMLRVRAAVAGAVVANAWVILAGSPQYVVYLFYVEVAAALVAAATPCWRKALAALAMMWVGAAAVSAPQWFPTLYYLPFTGRVTGTWMMAPRAPDRWNFWLEFALPFPLGDDLRSPHMHLKNVWETCTYPGTLTTLAALGAVVTAAALRRRRCPAETRLAWVIVLLGLYMCGGGWLPGFSSFREPMKARAVVALGMALAGGLGAQRLVAAARLRRVRRAGPGAWAGAAVAALMGAVAAGAALWLPRHADAVGRWLLIGGPPVDALRAVAWVRALARPALLVGPVVDACWQVAGWAALCAVVLAALHLRGRMFAPLLFCVAAIDPFSTHFHLFVARQPYSNFRLPPGFAEAIGQELARTRAQGRLPWRVTLPPSLANRGHLVEGLWDTSGYDPLMPRDANTRVVLESRRTDVPLEDKRTTIALAVGRRYDLNHWVPEQGEPLGDLRRFEVAPAAALFSVEDMLTAGFAGLSAFGPNLDTGRHYVDVEPPPREGERQPARKVVEFVAEVEQARQRGPTAPPRAESIALDSPNDYVYRVHCERPALAVFRTTWLPGWQVWIDGRYAGRPWCANRWMLAAPLEPGTHEVVWRYRPVGLSRCLVLSGLSCLVLAGWMLDGRRRRASGRR